MLDGFTTKYYPILPQLKGSYRKRIFKQDSSNCNFSKRNFYKFNFSQRKSIPSETP
jgi:hypothetical protein